MAKLRAFVLIFAMAIGTAAWEWPSIFTRDANRSKVRAGKYHVPIVFTRVTSCHARTSFFD
jgi:hypothetical protein